MNNFNQKNKTVTEKEVETKSFTQNKGSGIMNNKPRSYNTYKNAVTAAKSSPIRTPAYQPKPVTNPVQNVNQTVKPVEKPTQKVNETVNPQVGPAKKESGTTWASLNQGLNMRSYIPKEKKEQERLRKLTGSYDLKKVKPDELQGYARLKNKTPDDYYHNDYLPQKEMEKRLDEAFGPKTDFSVFNFENNYDKLNKEQQEMLVHKMQLDFNNLGYTDKYGYALKTDGIFGDKTKSVYEQYKKDNYSELEDDFKEKQKWDEEYKKYEDMAFKGSNGKPLLIASSEREIKGMISKDDKTEKNKDESRKSKDDYSDSKYIKDKTKETQGDRDKEVLAEDDYKKIQMYKAIYTFAKNEMKDDVIADSAHREAVAIRRQDKYSSHEDYGPVRVKKFVPSGDYQYVGIEGYTDNDYSYSDTKDTASIYISPPLSADDADWEGGRYLGIASNANAFTGQYEKLNYIAGIADFVISKIHPLYNKVQAGDRIITVKKHKGGYKASYQKEYKFFMDSNNNIYYLKK